LALGECDSIGFEEAIVCVAYDQETAIEAPKGVARRADGNDQERAEQPYR